MGRPRERLCLSCVPQREAETVVTAHLLERICILDEVVPRKGLEPSRPLSHWHLKPARLPIPPPGPGPVSPDRPRACQIGELAPKSIFWSMVFSEKPVATFPDHAQIHCTARTCWRIAKPLNTAATARI